MRTPRPRNELFRHAIDATHRSTSATPRRNWAHDRLADVAAEDINFTTRSNVNFGQVKAKAQAKIGA